LQFTNVQATGEALALKREQRALQKIKNLNFFFMFVGHFAVLDPGTPLHPDPDPQHWFSGKNEISQHSSSQASIKKFQALGEASRSPGRCSSSIFYNLKKIKV
jgi:hypothetical protein